MNSSWMVDQLTFYSNKKDDGGYPGLKPMVPMEVMVAHSMWSILLDGSFFGYLTRVAGAVAI